MRRTLVPSAAVAVATLATSCGSTGDVARPSGGEGTRPPAPPASIPAPEPLAVDEGCTPGAVSSGLVAYYPFDETAGTRTRDCSGNGRDGAILEPNATKWVRGHRGNALLLGGVRTCVDLHRPGFVQPASSFTAAAWVLIKTVPTTRTSRIVGHSRDVALEGWEMSLTPAGTVRFALSRRALPPVVIDAPAPIGRWTHVAGVFRAQDRARLFVDGVEVAAKPVAIASIQRDPTVHLRIGCRRPTLVDELAGTVDEVRVYDRALAAFEIAELAR